MPEIGQLSGSLEKKEYGYKPRSRVYAGPDWGWQTEESYNKIVQQRNRGLGSEAVDFIEEKAGQAFGFISQIPGVKQGLEFVGGVAKFVDRTTIQPAIQAAEDPSRAGTPEALIGTVFKAGQMAEQGGAQIARNLGVDPRIGSAVAGAAYETVTGAAVGKLGRVADALTPPGGGGLTPAMAGAGGPQLTMRGGSVNLQPTVNKLTITDPEFIAPGVRQGISQTPANLKARKMLDNSLARLQKRRDELNAGVASGEIEFKGGKWKRLDKKIREERYGEMSSFYNNLDQDPPAYRKKTDKNIDPTNEDVILEQHHLAAKAQTQPFVEAMLSVGDPDDLVALHEYSRMLGVVMGNSRLNMLDAPGPIHRSALAKTVKEKAGNIHQAFNAAGMEPNNKFVQNLLKDASTADDVMRIFSKYVQEYLIPQQNIAKKIVNQYFADYRVNLTPNQKARFDELVLKANKGGD